MEYEAIIGEILLFLSREFLKVMAPSLSSNLFTSATSYADRQMEETAVLFNFVMKFTPFKIAYAFAVVFLFVKNRKRKYGQNAANNCFSFSLLCLMTTPVMTD
jgi:hypothetical protein